MPATEGTYSPKARQAFRVYTNLSPKRDLRTCTGSKLDFEELNSASKTYGLRPFCKDRKGDFGELGAEGRFLENDSGTVSRAKNPTAESTKLLPQKSI